MTLNFVYTWNPCSYTDLVDADLGGQCFLKQHRKKIGHDTYDLAGCSDEVEDLPLQIETESSPGN